MKTLFEEPLWPEKPLEMQRADSRSGLMAFKGVNSDLQCRTFQFSVGPLHRHGTPDVAVSIGGFHSCIKPLDVLRFYPPGMSRYFLVQPSGQIALGACGIEQASECIRLLREFTLSQWVDTALRSTLDAAAARTITAQEHYSVASCEQDFSAALNSGHCSLTANVGDYAAACNDGHRGVASSTGDQSVVFSRGHHALAANTGNRSVAAAQGPQSLAGNSGHHGIAQVAGEASIASNTGSRALALCLGPRSIAVTTADHSQACADLQGSIALADGRAVKAKAAAGAAIILVHRGAHDELIHIRCGVAGKDLKADVWYGLGADGEFIEIF
ncbi:MAG: hypothetical protein E6Q75_13175 [Rheinheimera sp.]|nr:MAG: hypothetical protein E6Q75_13175 [Rheinheimera sp.]